MTKTGDPSTVLSWETLQALVARPGELVIDVDYAGMNYADHLLIKGEYQVALPLPCVPGSEFVGRVREVGAGTSLSVGTRVMGLALPPFGTFAEQCVALEARCEPLPEDLPGPEATCLIGNYVTAHLALHRRAGVVPHDVVLVTGAAGGVGTAAIQIAKAAGARVIAADLGADRAESCLASGADHAVDVTDRHELTRLVTEVTKGKGADIVVDLVGGDLFEVVRRLVAFEGRVVIVGFTGGTIPQIRLNQLLLRSFGVLGVNALTVLEKYPDIHRAARSAVVELLATGAVAPALAGVFPMTDLPATSIALAGRKLRGKAVLITKRKA